MLYCQNFIHHRKFFQADDTSVNLERYIEEKDSTSCLSLSSKTQFRKLFSLSAVTKAISFH